MIPKSEAGRGLIKHWSVGVGGVVEVMLEGRGSVLSVRLL